MKFFIISLGCPKNLTDSENFSARLLAHGHEMVFAPQGADIIIINTCGFLSSALKEAQGEIKKALALKKNGLVKRVAVTGCMVERLKEKMKKFNGADLIFSISEQDAIEKIINKKGLFLKPIQTTLNIPQYKLSLTAPHSAYLKIADGCDNRCAYCAIPAIRGPMRSKPMADILREAALMAENGVKEISLIAQDTTAYGLDLYGEIKFAELLKKLNKIPKLKWLRIMYAYAHRIDEQTAAVMAKSKKIVKYLDMPLQHISPKMLLAMNRHSTAAEIKKTIKLLRKYMPQIALRTNFIVGFPGETEEDFKELCSFVRRAKFDNVGVFEFQRERGTPAYTMKNQIPAAVKKQRAQILNEIQSRVVDAKNKKMLNKQIEVIADAPSLGRTYKDAPDIDGKVIFNRTHTPGKIFKARITKAEGYTREAA